MVEINDELTLEEEKKEIKINEANNHRRKRRNHKKN